MITEKMAVVCPDGKE
ncbi:Protein of unknown function [Bacillus cytotoxicus]|nr:Protein of unknown function [Bacillus cytotoxicus]